MVSFGIEKLARYGFREITIASYDQTARLQAYCGQGQRWGVTLRFEPQIQPWGAAGVLPQLWAVLRGEMALVGVKLVSPAAGQRLKEPWQRKRFDYSPGFTGLWFVQGGGGNDDE